MAFILTETLVERLAVQDAKWMDVEARETAPPELAVAYLDSDGQRLGDAVPSRLASAFTEAFLPDGTVGSVDALAPLRLPRPPGGSTVALFQRGDEQIWRSELGALERKLDPMPAVLPRTFGEEGAAFKFPVFSERFIDEEAFYRHVDDLYRFISVIPPFAGLRDKWALQAYYWRAPNVDGGWFDTFDRPYDCSETTTQVMYGDREKARSRLLHLMLHGKYGLILIDSTVRGGAGGLEEWQYPAWSTITPCKGLDGVAVERWEAVALHEMGHALGLCDEYLLPARKDENPRGEPNVSTQSDALDAGWSLPVNRPGNPTHSAGEPAEDRQAVGTYKGCRYREDLYRSSPQCLMRSTTTRYFCAVCSEHIAGRLG